MFDCSIEFKEKSIDHELMSGLDLTNQIVGVLLLFRKEEVVFMADIEAMFYQSKIPSDQRNYLRPLWWTIVTLTRKLLTLSCVHMYLEAPRHHHEATLLSRKLLLIMRRNLERWQLQH